MISRLRVRRGQRPRWGNLRRRRPFSEKYGLDRGTAVDRWYIDAFLHDHADDVRGACLEVKDDRYSRRFAGSSVTSVDVVDVDATNAAATVIADLSAPASLPTERFDCAIVTQTLQYVSDPFVAVANLWSSLRPGGTLLLTVPTVSRLDPTLGDIERWRFTPRGLAELGRRFCTGGTVEVFGSGNLITSVSFLLGLAVEDIDPRDLTDDDADFPIVAALRAVRPTAAPHP